MVHQNRIRGGLYLSITQGIIVLGETGAIYTAVYFKRNDFIYAGLLPFWFLGYLFFFYKNLTNFRFRQIVILLMIGFCIAFVYSPVLVPGNEWIPVVPVVVGSFAIVIASTMGFVEISQIRTEHSLRSDGLFWICCAMLTYYLPTAILVGAFDFFFNRAPSEYGNAYWDSQKILNIIHYSLFSFAYVCHIIFSASGKS